MPGIAIVAAILVALWVLREAGRMPAASQRRFTRLAMGYGLCIASAFFALKGLWIFAVPMFGFGAGILGWQNLMSSKPAPDLAPSVKMEREEAFDVLGLKATASADEIRAAHKKLLRAIHPDAGGSTYLAAKINAARDLLLKG